MKRLFVALFVLCALLPAAAGAAVEGVVLSAGGRPIEHARVEMARARAVAEADRPGRARTAGGESAVFTDSRGAFALPGAEPPLELVVTHPRFETVRVAIGGDRVVEIRLEPKQQIFEEIAVSANPGEDNFAPVSISSAVVDPQKTSAPPTTLTELVSAVPGVAENGQGGIFQTYSIRGVARLRVLTLIDGMRIVGERRAGVSASFLDPGLLRSVDVVKGPASTFYGSGALGGVVQLFARRFEGPAVETGYETDGDERHLLVGWGHGALSAGIAHRRAGDGETARGELLDSGFTQTSGAVEGAWERGGRRYRLQAIASAGRDIDKASTDAPERVTVYPEENHLLLRFELRTANDWRLEAWVHPNDLETRVTDDESVSEVENRAFDLGFNWQRQLRLGSGTEGRVGIDYFGRRGVDAIERVRELGPAPGAAGPEERTLDGAEEDEAGLYGALERNWGKAKLLAGARLAWQQQRNAGGPHRDDTAVTGFTGLVVPLGAGFELAANLGSGLRFPSLSERFFTGTTGRGRVIGSENLDPERSLNADLGLRWYGRRLYLSGYLFRNEIDDYIERVEVEPDVLSFVNLTSGTLEGLELDALYQLDDAWSLGFGGHLLEGRDDAGGSLADVPADRVHLGVNWRSGRWAVEGRWEERRAKDDPGSGEKAIGSASLVSATLRCELRPGLAVTVSGRNLLDEEYFNSADRKVPEAAGRSLGVGLRWRPK